MESITRVARSVAPLPLVSASGIDELAQWARGRLAAGAGRVLALPIAAAVCAPLLYLPLYLGSLSATAGAGRIHRHGHRPFT